MKRFASIAMLALVIALGSSVAQAGAKGAKPDKANKAGKKDHAGVTGTVSKVEGSSITVQTRGKQAAEVTVATDASTKFEGVAGVADIKAGMHIVATPTTGTAEKVIVQAAKEGKGAKKAKKAAK